MAKKRKLKKLRFLKFLFFIILLGGALYLYGAYFEINNYKVREYKITSKKITDDFDGFTIAHLSDIHYGRMIEKSELKQIVSMVNKVKPDVVVITGDLIDRDTKMTTDMANEIADILLKIQTNSGKYIIQGDHDTLFDEWENIVKNSGFINLNNTYDTIYNNSYDALFIAGASSFINKESINDKLQKATEYLNSFEKDGPLYNILLLHEPEYIDDLEKNKFDLILAGHSLNGQVNIPFYGAFITPEGAKKYYKNHYNINDHDLYISNGLGVMKYDFRLFNTPSFNVYRLIKDA